MGRAGRLLAVLGVFVATLAAQSEEEWPRTVPGAWALSETPGGFRGELDVLYVDRDWRVGWIGGEDGVVEYLAVGAEGALQAGQRIRFHPNAQFDGQPTEQNLAIDILSEGGTGSPMPFRSMAESILPGAGFYRFEGLVNRQEVLDPQHLRIEFAMDEMVWPAFVKISPAVETPSLTGRLVRFDAVFVKGEKAEDNTANGQLWISSLDKVEVLTPLAQDPTFEQPAVPIGDLAAGPAGHLVRIEGQVVEQHPGSLVVIEDATGRAELRTGQSLTLRRGDWIEAVGEPEVVGFERILRRARFRSLRDERQMREALGLSVVRSARRIVTMSAADVLQHYPAVVSGVIAWGDAGSGKAFLVDGTGGVELEWACVEELPPVGFGTVVSGTTQMGEQGPRLRVESMTWGGETVMPTAQVVTLGQVTSGFLEAQWVELPLLLAGVERSPSGSVVLQLIGKEGGIRAEAPGDRDWEAEVGSLVQVQGVCHRPAAAAGTESTPRLLVAHPDFVRLLQPPLARPFEEAGPILALGSLDLSAREVGSIGWQRVQGVVTYVEPDRYLYLQEGRVGVLVFLQPGERAQLNQSVEVVGLPGRLQGRPVLRAARVRPSSAELSLEPAILGEDAPVEAHYHGQVAVVEGVVLRAGGEFDGPALTIESGPRAIEIRGQRPFSAEAWPAPGSRVRAQGVYLPVYDEANVLRSFSILLASRGDLEVLRSASWWTARRAASLAGVLTLLLAAGLMWLVTLRRRVTEQTAELRHRLEHEAELLQRNTQIVENASDFIFTTDRDGVFLTVNPKGERLLGVSVAEIAPRRFHDFFCDEAGNSEFLPEWQDGAHAFRCLLRRGDERRTWVEISVRGLREDGEPSGFLGIVRDISQQKEYEEALERARASAEANSKTKSAFLANMSHEIRTPMNGVIGMSNLILETKLDSEQHSFARTIRDSAESLLTVINDILDFSKMEAGKLQFDWVSFDLVETIEGAIDVLAPKASAKGLELIGDLKWDLPTRFVGDPGRLRQVILNLAGNAIKFTEEGEVVIKVRAEDRDEGRALLRFEVRDTGIGVSESQKERLFLPFEQADVSTTRQFGGTGLGLAISRQIIEQWKGRIGVESVPGEGATFWFTLPLPFAQGVPPVPILAENDALEGCRALVVDDNATNRRLLRRYLTAWGLEVDTVDSGAEAIHAVDVSEDEGLSYDFVLLDFQMPDIDGAELASILNERPGHQVRKTVLLTSLDYRLFDDAKREVGVRACLTKPIRRSLLRQTMIALRSEEPTPEEVIEAPVVRETHRVLHALIAEDNLVNQRVARLQVERMGFQVEIVSNGVEALEALQGRSFDVVLMDCQMPEMDGYETTSRIRQNPRFADLRIIALTAHAMEGDRERCLEVGMNEYISKPVRPNELRLALERAGVLSSGMNAADSVTEVRP